MLRNLNQSSGGRRILGVPQVGIPAATIASQTATGPAGPGLLYDTSLIYPSAQLRAVITAWPASGTLTVWENGGFTLTGAADGTYSAGFDIYANNIKVGSDTASLQVGTGTGTSASAVGANLSGASAIVTSGANAQANATATGATLTGATTLATAGASAGAGTTLSPADIAAIASAVVALLQNSTIPVNLVAIRGQPIQGSGTTQDPWGP